MCCHCASCAEPRAKGVCMARLDSLDFSHRANLPRPRFRAIRLPRQSRARFWGVAPTSITIFSERVEVRGGPRRQDAGRIVFLDDAGSCPALGSRRSERLIIAVSHQPRAGPKYACRNRSAMTIPLGSAACAASAARGTLGTPSLFTGVQQSAIWQWGFVERLVNGLRYIEVGPERECRRIPRRRRGVG